MTRSAVARLPILAALLCLALSGCATIHRAPFTEAEQQAAVIPGLPEARFWADAPDAARRMRPAFRDADGRVAMLALSGGADEGAYGAGVLNGWSASGQRPVFSIVTGVSTGALIAPFAFLGPAYDPVIARVYTSIDAHDVYRWRFPLAIPGSTSAASTKPLTHLIDTQVTDAVIDAVAGEHRRGRRLLVGTANLDAQRMVVWDMGAIAASSLPGRRVLFRRILLASAAIPVLFPPVAIAAESNGRTIRELHVDGGTIAQVLSVPRQLIVSDADAPDSGRLSLYLLVNSRLGGDFHIVTPRTVPILKRAFALDLQSALFSLASTAYLYPHDHGIDYNLSYIGNDLPASSELFDTGYMRRLYAYGFQRGRTGSFWTKRPPGAER